jgi:hypothetical protein
LLYAQDLQQIFGLKFLLLQRFLIFLNNKEQNNLFKSQEVKNAFLPTKYFIL